MPDLPNALKKILNKELIMPDGRVGRVTLADGYIRSEIFTSNGWIPGSSIAEILWNGREISSPARRKASRTES